VGGFHSDLTFDRATGKSIAKVSCFSNGIPVRILEEFQSHLRKEVGKTPIK
jgi:hypothetical protein